MEWLAIFTSMESSSCEITSRGIRVDNKDTTTLWQQKKYNNFVSSSWTAVL